MLKTDLSFKQLLMQWKDRSKQSSIDSMFFDDNCKINGEITLAKTSDGEEVNDCSTAETLSDLDIYIENLIQE